jgi:hypothetical protein
MLDDYRKHGATWATYEEQFSNSLKAATSVPLFPEIFSTTQCCCVARTKLITVTAGWSRNTSRDNGAT